MHYIVGLGNPEEQYEETRHNIGRNIVRKFAKKFDFEDFAFDKKINALVSEGKIGKEKVTLILPETYMNKSGLSLKKIITSTKKAAQLTVVYDDLDLPIGTMKINFNKGSGGHKGVDSIIRSVRTKAFARLRVGIAPVTPGGKIKKPKGEEAVVKCVLGKFSPKENTAMKKLINHAVLSLESVVEDGYLIAGNRFN